MIENVPQMLLMLIENFREGQTISGLQGFNISFAMLMTVMTFAEHAGTELAAKFKYTFYNEFIHLKSVSEKGLSDHEKEFREQLLKIFKE